MPRCLLPWLRITLKVLKQNEIFSIVRGGHIRRCRLVRELTQTEAAKLLRISSATVVNWETGKTETSIASIPAIVRWLGYDLPTPNPRPSLTICWPSVGLSAGQSRKPPGVLA